MSNATVIHLGPSATFCDTLVPGLTTRAVFIGPMTVPTVNFVTQQGSVVAIPTEGVQIDLQVNTVVATSSYTPIYIY